MLLYAAAGFTMVAGWYRLRYGVVPICLALSVMIETSQFLVLGRVAALDDVLLNVVGAALGYLAAEVFTRLGFRVRAQAAEPVGPESTTRSCARRAAGTGSLSLRRRIGA